MKLDYEKILYDAQNQGKICQAWYCFNDQIIKAEVKLQTIKKDRNELVFRVAPGSGKYVEQIISGSGKINLFVKDESLLFSSELKEYQAEEGSLIVGLPERYKFFDRRDKDRIEGLEDVDIELTVNGKAIRKNCLDISAGGCSVIFTQTEDSNLRLKEKMDFDACLYLGDAKIQVKALVVQRVKLTPYKYENCPYGGARVSMQFKDIDDLLAQKIKKYIYANQELIDQF